MFRYLVTTMLYGAVLALTLVTSVQASTTISEVDDSKVFEKRYVQPDQIRFTAEGIFYYTQEGITVPVQWMSHDAEGLYVIMEFYRCPLCGWVNPDDVCINMKCPLFGQ